MRRYHLLAVLTIFGIILPACSPPAAPAEPALPLSNISCRELSLYLDPALGDSLSCQAVPGSSDSDIPMEIFIYPEHTALAVQNYPLAPAQFPPEMRIYPVEAYSALLPDLIQGRLTDLDNRFSEQSWSNGELPFLPPLPMIQTFYTHPAVLSFNGGRGIRFVTNYHDASLPVSNQTIFYTFQGLTADGKYWVAATFPISSPLLAEGGEYYPPAQDSLDESWFQQYPAYIRGLTEALARQDPGSFFPSLSTLDALVQTITIHE